MPKNQKIIIIIPTHNEALVIAETIQQVFEEIAHIPDYDLDILVFDSASKDQTQAIVRRLMTLYPGRLHLQTEAKKTGLGSAYLQAMRYALSDLKADVVVEFDADLSHQPKYLAPMIASLKTHDVVLGSRYVEGGTIPASWPLIRRLLSILGNRLARLLLSPVYRDFTSGFRMTRAGVLAQCLTDQFLSNHYAYKLHLFWLLHQSKARIHEYPIEFFDRQKGTSKLPRFSILDSLRVLLILRWRMIKT